MFRSIFELRKDPWDRKDSVALADPDVQEPEATERMGPGLG